MKIKNVLNTSVCVAWCNSSFVFIVLKNDDVRSFLEEATALDPRFKSLMDSNTAVWERIKGKILANSEEVKCHSYTNILSPSLINILYLTLYFLDFLITLVEQLYC